MANLNQQIISALKNLIRKNGGEIHGHWPQIADKLACEIGGNPDDYIVQKFEQHLRELGLKYFLEDHPDIYYMRGMTGELNFIDRKLVYVASECTVHKEPGCEPVITWREVDNG
jgi:hypothetical protein